MKSTIQESIDKAIAQNLPAQIGKVLQERLKELEEKELELENLEKNHKRLLLENDDLQKKYTSLVGLENKQEEIYKNAEALRIRELEFLATQTIQENQVASSKEMVNMMNNFVGLLVKNPQAVTTMFTNNQNLKSYRQDGSTDTETLGYNSTATTDQIK